MIGVLSGTVRHGCVLTAAGVGYRVESLETLAEGADVELVVEAVASQADTRLFAFPGALERDAFVALCRLPGVGPAAAMAVLRHLGVAGLCTAVGAKDTGAVTRAKGVGARGAAAIVTGFNPAPFVERLDPDAPGPTPVDDRFDVLVQLGYREDDARWALDGLVGPDDEVLAAALARLAARLAEGARR